MAKKKDQSSDSEHAAAEDEAEAADSAERNQIHRIERKKDEDQATKAPKQRNLKKKQVFCEIRV
jgi:hypothetical protein